MNFRAILYVAIPAAAVGVFAAGLRIGARSPAYSAVVFALRSNEGKTTELRVVTSYVASGVPEVKPLDGLELVMRVGNRDAVWTGATNLDGMVDVSLAPSAPAPGQTVHVTLREHGNVILDEDARFPSLEAGQTSSSTLRPTETKGDLKLTVEMPQGAASVNDETYAYVRATSDGQPSPITELAVEPEPGLKAMATEKCNASGAFLVTLRASYHITGLRLLAKGDRAMTGEWFGGLPVGRGAPSMTVPDVREHVVVVNPTGSSGTIYFEIVTVDGRVMAESKSYGGTSPAFATFPIKGLSDGAYWVTASHSPRMSTALDETIARSPMRLGGDPRDRCRNTGETLTRLPGRAMFIDGSVTRRTKQLPVRKRGLTVSLLGLLFGGTAGAWLLLDAAHRSRVRLRNALAADGDTSAAPTEGRGVAMVVLLVLAGFTLLAALLFLGSPT